MAIRNVRDPRGRYWIIDDQRRIRYELTGPGARRAARALYGPLERDVDLTGWTEGPTAVDVFGGGNEMERVVAGHRRDPLTGGFVDDPRAITSANGVTFDPRARGADPGPAPSPEDRSASARLAETLREWGLEPLADQALEWIREGLSDVEIVQEIRKTDVYRDRFGAIIRRRKEGLAPMSEAELIAYERQARALFRQAGLPRTLWADTAAFREIVADQVVAGRSMVELGQVVGEQFRRVADAPQEVRDVFEEMFPGHGDGALATIFLDPDRSVPALERAVSLAEVEGVGAVFGFDVPRGLSRQLVDFGFRFDEARGVFERASRFRELSSTLAFERRDLSQRDLVRGVAGVDSDALERLRRRQESRAAVFGGGGGPVVTARGVIGAGSAGQSGAG